MLYVLLHIVFSLGFVQLFKWGQRRRDDPATLVAGNYGLGAAGAAALTLLPGGSLPDGPLVPVGVLGGFAFIASIAALNWGLRRAPVAPVLLSFRLAIVIPVAASVAWGDPAGAPRLAGCALALPALALLAPRAGGSGPARGGALVIAAVFLAESAAKTSMRFAREQALDRPIVWPYIGVVYATACAAAILWLLARGGFRSGSLPLGFLIGAVNLAATGLALLAIGAVGGAVFFPASGVGTVILDTLLAVFLWREPPDRRTWAGIAAGIAAISLVTAG